MSRDWASTLINGLYGQFVLRDIFGKIMPGFIVLVSLSGFGLFAQ